MRESGLILEVNPQGDNQLSKNDITTKPYAKWLEATLQETLKMPIKSIGFVAKLNDGAVFTSYSDECSMMDKLQFSGIIQQDAMIDMMEANGIITTEEDDDTED